MLDSLNPLRKSLLAQIVATFSLLSLVTVSLVSYTAYRQARDAIEEAVYEQLKSTVSLKEYQLIEWLETQRREATVLARSPLVVEAIHSLMSESAREAAEESENTPSPNRTGNPSNTGNTSAGTSAAITLQNYLKLVTEIENNLYTVDILTEDGKVILSNRADRTGQIVPIEKTTYFESDRTHQATEPEIVSPNIYLNAIGVPTITLATPVVEETGRSLDILLATTPRSEIVDQIVRQRASLGESGEAYLVKNIGGRNLFLAGTPTVRGYTSGEDASTETPTEPTPDAFKLSSEGIEQALNGIDGKGLYRNYQNVPVVGIYRWLDQYEVALVAELSQQEAFRPAFTLARGIFAVGIFTAGVLLLLVYVLARHIVHPILLMSRAAAALESNRFQPSMLQSVGDRPDELGQLARTFNHMAHRMYVRQARLKAKIQEGNERISKLFEQSNLSDTNLTVGRQQASELELAYYDALKRKAAWLRQQSSKISPLK